MDISRRTMKGLLDLGVTLPDHTSIEIFVMDKGGNRVCHKFSVVEGSVHHKGSHSSDFVQPGTGPLADR